MNQRTALLTSLFFTALGLLLSGYLSFYTLFRSGCHKGFLPFLNCGSNPVKFWGVPQCVVGFAMYFIVAVLVLVGIMVAAKRLAMLKAVTSIGVLGVLFSGTLAVYELWFQKPTPTTLPACVYGFFLYLGIVIVGMLALRTKDPGQTGTPQVVPPLPPQ